MLNREKLYFGVTPLFTLLWHGLEDSLFSCIFCLNVVFFLYQDTTEDTL